MTTSSNGGRTFWDSWLWDITVWLLFAMIAVGALAYTLHYILTLVPNSTIGATPSPIDLAGVSGTIGSLLLVGVFVRSGNPMEKELKGIGKAFLGAAVGFTIAFLLIEWVRIDTSKTLNAWEWIMVVGSDLSIILAGVSLAVALVWLVKILPKL